MLSLAKSMVRSRWLEYPAIIGGIASLLWIWFPIALHAQAPEPGGACFLRTPVQGRSVKGMILRFETPELAQKNIELTQSRARGLIDPNYVSQLRAVIRVDETGQTVGALVPAGMDAHVGQRITFTTAHRSKLPCHYIPNLIINPLVS